MPGHRAHPVPRTTIRLLTPGSSPSTTRTAVKLRADVSHQADTQEVVFSPVAVDYSTRALQLQYSKYLILTTIYTEH